MNQNVFEGADRHHFVPGESGLSIVGGDGAYLHTADGRRILDAAGGAIVANIGHGRTEVADAVHRALTKVDYVLPGWPTENRLRLHDRLVDHWLPEGMNRVFFASGGSEAADSSLRLARAYQLAMGRPERWKIVGRHPSYHGITLGALSAGSHLTRRGPYEPQLQQGFPKVHWNDPADVERVIMAEGPDTIAGFIFEPITGASGGCLMADLEYWRVVADICHRHDILLIADEVMTGIGRTGTKWGYEHLGFTPDIIFGTKGLAGGYVPIAMVAAMERVAEPLQKIGGFMFFTFTGSDAMCAAADCVLDIIEREHLIDNVNVMGPLLERRLKMELGDHPHVADIRGRGLFYGVELARNRHAGEQFDPSLKFAFKVAAEALDRGMWIYPGGSGPVTDVMMFGFPFVVTESDIELAVSTLRDSLDAALATVS
jgi:adenosylmethionine-8-amino-7-oxononanoate aminotransferase